MLDSFLRNVHQSSVDRVDTWSHTTDSATGAVSYTMKSTTRAKEISWAKAFKDEKARRHVAQTIATFLTMPGMLAELQFYQVGSGQVGEGWATWSCYGHADPLTHVPVVCARRYGLA